VLEYTSKLNVATSKTYHESLIRDAACGPPGCITWLAATFVNCVCTITIIQQFRRLGIPIAVIFPRAAREPAHSNGRVPLP
jgi:hypothetical protein